MRTILLTVFFCTFLKPVFAASFDSASVPLVLSIGNHTTAYSRFPLPSNNHPFHPSILAGTFIKLAGESTLFTYQGVKLGYYYHAFSQHAIRLLGETGVRFLIIPKLELKAALLYGYLHSIPDIQQFELVNGIYENSSGLGRAQFTAGLSLGATYSPQLTAPLGYLLEYHFMVQGPFVKSYVPVLPGASLNIGIVYPLNFRKN